MQPRALQVRVAIACAGAGVLIGALCLVVAVIGAFFGGDWAIAFPDAGIRSRLWLVFLGVGLLGALPFAPFAIWLSERGIQYVRSAAWIIGAASAGALIGEFIALRSAMTSYAAVLPGFLLGSIGGAFGGAIAAATILIAKANPDRQPGPQ